MATSRPDSPGNPAIQPQLVNNPVLESLKAAMGDKAHLLESLLLHNIPISPHNDHKRLGKKTTSRFKLELGTYNDSNKNHEHVVFAYLVENNRDQRYLEMAAYYFPDEELGAGKQISCASACNPLSVQLHKIFTIVSTPQYLSTLVKLFFIHYQTEVTGPVKFSGAFLAEVGLICSRQSKKKEQKMMNPKVPARGHASGSLDKVFGATISSSVGQSFKHPLKPKPAKRSPAEPPRASLPSAAESTNLLLSQLQKDFTQPVEAAQAEEKTTRDRITSAKQRLDHKEKEIEKIRNDLAEAERGKAALRCEIARYNRQLEQSLATQQQLFDGLDPGLKAFMKVGRAIHSPEEGEPSPKKQRKL